MRQEEYNGWKNRETWALHLNLVNDEWLYEETMLQVKDAIMLWEDEPNDCRPSTPSVHIQKALREQVTEYVSEVYAGQAHIDIRNLVLDVGSLWRVGWAELAEAFLSDVNP